MKNTLMNILAEQKKERERFKKEEELHLPPQPLSEPESRPTHGKLKFVWEKTDTGFLSPIEHMLAIARYNLPLPPGRRASEYTGYCNAQRIKIGETIFFDHSKCPHNAATLEEQLELKRLEFSNAAEALKDPKKLEEYVLSSGGTYKGKKLKKA